MFGFNLKDDDGELLYKELSFAELEALVAEMKAKAKAETFDHMQLLADSIQREGVSAEQVGPFVRVTGNKDPLKAWNRFVRLGLHALQVCYYEMDVPEMGRVGQLTLVDNYKWPLEKELILGFVDMFFDYKAGEWRVMETPPHVAVVVEKCK